MTYGHFGAKGMSGLGNDDTIVDLSQFSNPIGDALPSAPVTIPINLPVNGTGTGGFNAGQSLTLGINTGLSILKDIFGGPQPGTYIRQADGSIVYRMSDSNTGAAQILPGGGFSTIGGPNLTTMLLIGGGVLLLLAMSGGKDHK